MQTDQPSVLIAVVGPTASGKTDVAIDLCRALDAEAISMDSMQVYRRMDIGTAKPSLEERGGIAHHQMDVAEPGVPFSVADYRQLADAAIADIAARGKLPLLVGGTGFYLNAVTLEMGFADAAADEAVRRELEAEAEADGKEALHARLAQVDPPTAARLHANDVRRVIRALEVYRVTGKPMSEHANDFKAKPRGSLLIAVGLTMDRASLYARIDSRVQKMLDQGWLSEAEALLRSGVPTDSQALQAIGYRELLSVLRGQASLEEIIPRIQQGTRQYAKRQLTWFRHDARIHWFDRGNYADHGALVSAILGYIRKHIAEHTASSMED